MQQPQMMPPPQQQYGGYPQPSQQNYQQMQDQLPPQPQYDPSQMPPPQQQYQQMPPPAQYQQQAPPQYQQQQPGVATPIQQNMQQNQFSQPAPYSQPNYGQMPPVGHTQDPNQFIPQHQQQPYANMQQQQPPQQMQSAQFASVQPRTREERNQMGDREYIEQARLRDRIGQYHKYVDNALLNAPDPTSSHFLPEDDRFVRDFAAVEKARREQQHRIKQQQIDSKRIQKYERDLKRWEYMEDEQERQSRRVQKMQEKYQVGNANKGGAAYNILNLNYDNTREGEYLKLRDDDAKVRSLLRSKNIDTLSNNQHNLLNGEARRQVEVPEHPTYNPGPQHRPPGSQGSALGRAGAQVFGDGFAGRPIRGMEKDFGKRVVGSPYSNWGGKAEGLPSTHNQSQPALPINAAQNQLYGNQPVPQQQQFQQPVAPPQQSTLFGQGGAGTKFY